MIIEEGELRLSFFCGRKAAGGLCLHDPAAPERPPDQDTALSLVMIPALTRDNWISCTVLFTI